MIVITIVIQAFFVSCSISVLSSLAGWLSKPPFSLRIGISLACFACWLVVGMAIAVCGWAIVFIYVGAFQQFEPSLYFSIVTFTTVGYGDVVVGPQWRLLAGLTATNGLIVFGLNTAVLVEFMNHAHNAKLPEDKETTLT